jgi:hypothetical protein
MLLPPSCENWRFRVQKLSHEEGRSRLGPHQYRQAFTPLLSIWPHPSAPRLGHSKTLEQQRRIAGLQLDERADTDGVGTGA